VELLKDPRAPGRRAVAGGHQYAGSVPSVLSVNLAHPMTNPDTLRSPTGIDKRPTEGPVEVRAPGPMRTGLGSGLVGDVIGNTKLHGGDDQAVYVYAREDLDHWEQTLQRELPNGTFGENLTIEGIDVTAALIGEQWVIGSGGLRLEVSAPRTPCRTFAAWLDRKGWIKQFTAAGTPGTYLRVLTPGPVSAGDVIEVVSRPGHDVTVGLVFRAVMAEPDLLPLLADAAALPEEIKAKVRKRRAE